MSSRILNRVAPTSNQRPTIWFFIGAAIVARYAIGLLTTSATFVLLLYLGLGSGFMLFTAVGLML